MTCAEWRLGGRAVGGMVRMDENWPERVAPRWVVYFAVTDRDAAVALAADLGARWRCRPWTPRPGGSR